MNRPRIVIVGAGFAGYQTARTLSRLAGRAEIVLLNPTDYFLYLPLLPQVAAGVLEPRRVTVSLPGPCRGYAWCSARSTGIDLDGRTVALHRPRGPTGRSLRPARARRRQRQQAAADPGVAEHAHGFRGLPEALYLRDHMTRQIELAAPPTTRRSGPPAAPSWWSAPATPAPRSPRTGRCSPTRWPPAHRLRGGTAALAAAGHRRRGYCPSWTSGCPRTADRVLRQRGVDVRTGTSVKEATADGVLLDRRRVRRDPHRWSGASGVRPDPLVADVGLPPRSGRLVVDPYLDVPGHPEVFACGDAAAVPDLTAPASTRR